MTPEEQDATQYRFSGYQLPLIQLDEIGPAYVVLPPHPYFRNQPTYWAKPAYTGNSFPTYGMASGDLPVTPGNTYETNTGNGLIDLMPF